MPQKISELVTKLSNFSCTGKPLELSIIHAQQELGVAFADDYLELVANYGAISYTGHNLTGISPFRGNDVVNVTKENFSHNQNIPHVFYVIEEAHLDDIVIWQASTGEIYQTEFNGKPHLICKSLAEYIESI